ncbi:MAG: response regulator [Phycisphaerales bacterium]|nr:MAG: response regulator [Phycisphaerales bacterium]
MDETAYKLLLIEDSKFDQKAFIRFVEEEGLAYDYTIAESVCEALEILKSEQFDVIIADYSLGDGTAIDIMDFANDLPIIIITAVHAEEVVVNSWKAGAYDYIAKDFGLNHLKAIPRTVDNVVQRKRLEDELSRRQRNLEAIFNTVPVGMLLVDENTVITCVNDAIKRKVQRDYPQIINRQIGPALGCIYVTDGDVECGRTQACEACLYQQIIERVLETRHSVRDVETNPTLRIRGEQVELWLRLSAGPVSIDGRKYVAIALDDITELKKAETRQAQLLKEVENTNKELCDFASIVSHDLKAPLRGIRTLAGWIADDYADKLGDAGLKQINELTSRVDRMYELIEGVLEYSSVGHAKEEPVEVDLNVLVPEVIDLLAPPEGITVTVENELPTIECDRTRVAQVFQNLLSNAIKYMDKPRGQVRVGCVEDGDFWQFSVADNGPGIEEKHFEEVFQMFQTVLSGRRGESTGVGLTVVKKIIELYGGKIWIESESGEGATFFFTLPKQKVKTGHEELEANFVH